MQDVWILFEQLDAWEPPAGGAAASSGALSSRPPNTKGADALVSETRDLTLKQAVIAVMEAGLCPTKPLNWWFGH